MERGVYRKLAPVKTEDDGKRLIGGDALSDCLKRNLAQFFKFDLNDVSIHHYIPAGPRWWRDPDGYTMGYDVYFRKGKYDPSDLNKGLRLIVHELVHVEQFQQAGGMLAFARQYKALYDANRKKGMNDEDAYRNIPFEGAAEKRAGEIINAISGMNNGKSPCAK